LPVGVDFIARPLDEAMLFRIAAAFEAPPGVETRRRNLSFRE
jgi:Asp-tRNA(Asn)/Glu-tRNA(Gln) amidotransferase A subunit family amidase